MENYCPLPFGHVCADTLGDYQICCQHDVPESYKENISDTEPVKWFQNQYLQQVKESFKNNEKHPGCSACWQHEESSIPSLRQRIQKEYQILGHEPYQDKILNIEIQAGNLCNLSCVMCNEKESSVILAENQRLGINVLTLQDVKWNDEAWSNVEKLIEMKPRVINIRGGEPLYNKKLLELVESIPQAQCQQTMLHITTNGTVWNEKWQSALSRFKHVRMMLSIDATKDVYEYIRFPANWNTLESNVDKIVQNKNIKVLVHCVVQNLNICYLEELIDWCKSKSLYLQFARCSVPTWLDFTNIPDSKIDLAVEQLERCLKKADENISKTFLKSAIRELSERKQQGSNQTLWNEFLYNMSLREGLRNNSHKKILDY